MQLIDRDVGITLKRAYRGLGFWGRIKLMSGLGMSLFDNEQVDAAEIEKLKQGDMLESSFGEFAAQSPPIFEELIAERDSYRAARLREANTPAHGEPTEPHAQDEKRLGVPVGIGAGQLKCMSVQWREATETPEPRRERRE